MKPFSLGHCSSLLRGQQSPIDPLQMVLCHEQFHAVQQHNPLFASFEGIATTVAHGVDALSRSGKIVLLQVGTGFYKKAPRLRFGLLAALGGL